MSPGGSTLALADPLRLGLTRATMPVHYSAQHRTIRYCPQATG
jgi:hypothetical protein